MEYTTEIYFYQSLPVKGKNATHIQIQVYFDPREDKKGYWLSVQPMIFEGSQQNVELWTYYNCPGIYQLLKSVQNKSNEAKNEALKLASENQDAIIACVCRQQGLVLLDS